MERVLLLFSYLPVPPALLRERESGSHVFVHDLCRRLSVVVTVVHFRKNLHDLSERAVRGCVEDQPRDLLVLLAPPLLWLRAHRPDARNLQKLSSLLNKQFPLMSS